MEPLGGEFQLWFLGSINHLVLFYSNLKTLIEKFPVLLNLPSILHLLFGGGCRLKQHELRPSSPSCMTLAPTVR